MAKREKCTCGRFLPTNKWDDPKTHCFRDRAAEENVCASMTEARIAALREASAMLGTWDTKAADCVRRMATKLRRQQRGRKG